MIRLRPLSFGDVPAIAALLGGDYEGVMQTSRIPWPYREADAAAFVEHVLSQPETSWGIEEAASGAFAGVIGFVPGAEPEIGYWVGTPFRGQGFATEAVRLVVANLRARGVRTVHAHVFPGNTASARVLQKNGFVYTCAVELDVPQRGGLRRFHVFALDLTTLPD
jgi:RimJ/RimL family protein N-acetyltransferase